MARIWTRPGSATRLCAAIVCGLIMGQSLAQPDGRLSDREVADAAAVEWPTHGGDLGNSRYAPLNQINAGNFSSLEVAWHFSTANLGPQAEFLYESTPLVVDDILYSTGGSRRAVFALDAATGELLWVYSLDEGARGANAPRRLSGRGLAYWAPDRGPGVDRNDARILFVTPGYRLISLNARTGKPDPTFGEDGLVDLKTGFDQDIDLETAEVGLNAAPTVVEDIIIVGAAHGGGAAPASRENVKGFVRGFNVRTGERLWIFHTIPQTGEFGNATWLDESWRWSGNTGVWTQIAVDRELGLAFLPVESPTGDYYGGTRPGENLFGESLVAIDYRSGERRWHYQLVHHPIWDYDVSAPPMLVDVVRDGETIPAIAQATKQSYIYVLDRRTGEAVFPIPEMPVPSGDVPGEWYSPTQPIPTILLGRDEITEDDLIDFTPALREAALAFSENYTFGHLYTPPALSRPDGPLAALLPMGGTNWPGGAYDPETRTVFVPASWNVRTMSVLPQQDSSMPFVSGIATAERPTAPPPRPARQATGDEPPRASTPGVPFAGDMTIDGLPLLKPPYGTISAVSMDTGEVVWTVPHGETPESVSAHPALAGLEIPRTGRDGFVAPVVTRSLLIVGEPSFGPTPSGARGAMLRAYDKTTGQEVGAVYMPAPQTGSPISYAVDNRQYVVLPISGAGYPGALIAFRLPDPQVPSPFATDPRLSGILPATLERNVWDGVYTDEQAARGAEIYATTCAACHGGGLEGLEMAPPLSGIRFGQNWNGQPLQTLHDRIVAMPPTTPGIVSADEATDVLSYILQRARFPAGIEELSTERSALDQIEYRTTAPD